MVQGSSTGTPRAPTMTRAIDTPPRPTPDPSCTGTAPRLSSARFPAAIYAVGDVHGQLDLLKRLEDRIVADAATISGEVWLVMLGDYVDRGPSSAQTLDHLLVPPPEGMRRICLGGNHEDIMLAALEDARAFASWCRLGGIETLASYGIPARAAHGGWEAARDLMAAHIPPEHRDFLAGLPVMLRVPGYVFVHAGMMPGVAPEAQTDRDLRWIRERFLDADHDFGATVVHGHTIAPDVHVSARRIGLDLGAFASGRLAAARLMPDAPPTIIETEH